MCKLPMESLQTSGILWFKDLTLADPYFLLPLLATGSILAILQVGKQFLFTEPKYRKTPLKLLDHLGRTADSNSRPYLFA
jgi:hypothetical protein